MQAVMLEKALYKVPHEHKLFEAPPGAELSEDERAEYFDKSSSEKTNDDYKAI